MGCESCEKVRKLSGDQAALCGGCVATLKYLDEQAEARLESLWEYVKALSDAS